MRLPSPMEEMSTSFHQPSLKSDYLGTSQNHSGTTSPSDSSSTLLAQRSLVSIGTMISIDGALVVASTSNSNNITHNTASSFTTSELDVLRVEIITNKLVSQNINPQAVEDLLVQPLVHSGTNNRRYLLSQRIQ